MTSSLLSNTSSLLRPKRSFFSHGQFRSNLSFPLQRQQPPHLAIRAYWKRTQQFAVKASGEQGPLCMRQFKVQASSFDGADSREEKSKLPHRDTNKNEQGGKVEAASNNRGHLIHFATISFFIILFTLLFRLRPTVQIFPFNQQRTKTPQQNFPSSHPPIPEKPNKAWVIQILSPIRALVVAQVLSINTLMNNIIAIKNGINYAVNFYYCYKDKIMKYYKDKIIKYYKDKIMKYFMGYLGIVFGITIINFALLISLWLQMDKNYKWNGRAARKE